MVRVLERIARFYYAESCGQCTPCREGTGWMYRHSVDSTISSKGRRPHIERELFFLDALADVLGQLQLALRFVHVRVRRWRREPTWCRGHRDSGPTHRDIEFDHRGIIRFLAIGQHVVPTRGLRQVCQERAEVIRVPGNRAVGSVGNIGESLLAALRRPERVVYCVVAEAANVERVEHGVRRLQVLHRFFEALSQIGATETGLGVDVVRLSGLQQHGIVGELIERLPRQDLVGEPGGEQQDVLAAARSR